MSVYAFDYRSETIEELLAQPAARILGEFRIELALVPRWEEIPSAIGDERVQSGA